MNKSVFAFTVFACVVGVIAWRVCTGPVVQGWAWAFGFCEVWGGVGLLLAFAVTFPILRRIDLLFGLLVGGAFVLLLVGGVLSQGFEELQLQRDGRIELTANQLATVPHEQPRNATLSGVWRYDLAARGTYVHTFTHDTSQDFSYCNVVNMEFCRIPIVGTTWQPGDPVLAVAAAADKCPKAGTTGAPEPRAGVEVTLYPYADGGSLGWTELEKLDHVGTTIDAHAVCAHTPDDQHADLSHAPFKLDPPTAFFVVYRAHYNAQPTLTVYAVFVLCSLAFIFRGAWRRGRVLRKSELGAGAGAAGWLPIARVWRGRKRQ